ncbi:hypothetical protein SAMD00019534_066580 [Acytostelium subglobosum LB1]|uniref:hypothetical protein n=1 Tax=Acytostelium subglobosum LB1 TaxID=1410327 RepID=UPI000644A9F5|nr:hypothetical protein SAMD00019534_066580 [Acytostelium subglobosum LB1]GAM23483.1 hypothetical protein SAMD00019534_066580 [Acytostelium subglobosum LB1]|eukprot:XP_012753224.1 hypothetical protein SAMD00019534_066580 [Acytostelium subglobosum LB1]
MGLYYSLFEFYNPLYLNDVNSGVPPTTNTYVTTHMMPQLLDLVNTYEPEVVWSDGDEGENSTYWQSTEFLAWLYNESPVKDTVVVNDRWGLDCDGKNGGFITPSDRFNPGYLIKRKWENCYTIGTSWGYNQNEPLSEYQNISSLVQTLVSTVSCGGNLLLNVGPTSDGVIPMIMQLRLMEIGQWLDINGEAIYNTTFWRVQNDTLASDLWYTTNLESGAVYAMSYNWADGNGDLHLEAPIASHETKITLFGYGGEIKFTPREFGAGLTLHLPFLAPGEYPPHGVYTFKMMNVK